MTNVREPQSDRTGAVAVGNRRRRPVWLFLLLALLALLLLAWLLYALLHTSASHKKTSSPKPAASAAASAAGTSPSTASYGAALVGGAGVAAHPATGTEAAGASTASTSGTTGTTGTNIPQGTILFPSGSAMLDSAGRQVISAAAIRLKALHAARVTVTGYTDVVGGQPKNDNLSQQRADAVAALLRDALGAATPVTTSARGESDAVAPNTTAAGRQQNRRASITSTES